MDGIIDTMMRLVLLLVLVLVGCSAPAESTKFDSLDGEASVETSGSGGSGAGAGASGSGGLSGRSTGDLGDGTTSASSGSSGGAVANVGGSSGQSSTGGSGQSSAGGSGGVGTTSATTGVAGTCEPPVDVSAAISSLVFQGVGYEEGVSKLCGSAVSGDVRCAQEPCLSVEFDVSAVPWSDDGLVLKLEYSAIDPWLLPMIHDCGTVVYECNKIVEVSYDTVYFLELRKVGDGFAVKAFYASGDSPEQAHSANLLEAGQSYDGKTLRDVAPEECASPYNGSSMLLAAWSEYEDQVKSLEWGCSGELR